jgi:hypothetical protein
MAYTSFFDDMPTEEPEPRVHHPWDPPETEFPAVVPSGPEPAPARRSFRLGLQFADGTRVIGQHGGSRLSGDDEPAGPILRTFLGGGGPRSSFWRWWAWPLPPPGPMEFVCEWPALGIPETRAGLDAQLILDAAGRSIRLWSEVEG